MSNAFRLTDETRTMVGNLRAALESEAEGFSNVWARRSEKWKDTPGGIAADAWIEELEDLRDTLDNLDLEAPEG